MNKQGVLRFFRLLSERFDQPCRIILTGAGAGALHGRIRSTLDLDFAVKLVSPGNEKLWEDFREACHEVRGLTGILVQYAEDIDHWSSITLLDYERHTVPFGKFGSMEVHVLEPSYWAIGKLARYLDPDIRDLVEVLKKTKTPWRELVRVLGRALKESPKSTACFLFRRQVEDFLSAYGKKIWGETYSKEKAINEFYLYAGVKLA